MCAAAGKSVGTTEIANGPDTKTTPRDSGAIHTHTGELWCRQAARAGHAGGTAWLQTWQASDTRSSPTSAVPECCGAKSIVTVTCSPAPSTKVAGDTEKLEATTAAGPAVKRVEGWAAMEAGSNGAAGSPAGVWLRQSMVLTG